jgi:ABC-type spermidine/putrescine transport system permease subunit I
MILVLVPFWTSILVKSFAFTVILGNAGIINSALKAVGLPSVKLLFNRTGVIIGMSHFLIPFMVFPIMASLVSQPPELSRAAEIMGASRLRIFFKITFPLSMPGVMAGSLLVLIMSFGFFVVPALLGSRQDMMMANLVDFYTRETLNWQMGSAISVLLLLISGLLALGLAKIPGGSTIFGGEDQ